MKNHPPPHLPFLTHIERRRDVLEDATEHAYVWVPLWIYTDNQVEFYWECSYIISWMRCLRFCLYQGDHVILMPFPGMFQEFQEATGHLIFDPPTIKDMGL